MSCLVEKFRYYIDLSEAEAKLLNRLEEHNESYKKYDLICQQGDPTEHIYVVKDGWFASFSDLKDGGRLILNIHFPGDIIGAVTLPFEESICGLIALTPGILCPFPKYGMKTVLSECPTLTALIFAMGMQDSVVLIDRLKAIGRMAGEKRVALLLLQIWTRQKVTQPNIGHSFQLPVSQEVMGDALGLTSVYVNRMLKQLKREGWIDYNNRILTLKNTEALSYHCDFTDRYYKLDTNWYP